MILHFLNLNLVVAGSIQDELWVGLGVWGDKKRKKLTSLIPLTCQLIIWKERNHKALRRIFFFPHLDRVSDSSREDRVRDS